MLINDEILSLPSPSKEGDGFVELSNGDGYRLLRKKILPFNGSFIHPNDHKTKIFVDKAMAEALVRNFDRLDFPVQVPVVNDNNQHVEDPLRNAGVVTKLTYDDTGVYATIEARKFADDFGKTILGASAFMHLNYIDTATGERVGPTLLHVAATNRPHINGLGEFEDMVKASADISDEQTILFLSEDSSADENPVVEDAPVEPVVEEQEPVVPNSETHEDGQMTPEEMIAALKETGIDVEALQADATRAVELSAQLEAVNEQLRLSGTSAVSTEDIAASVLELSSTAQALASKVDTLEAANATYVKREAEHEVDSLVLSGRVLPAQRDALVALSMSDREMFDAIVPDKAIVSLSESGVTTHDESTRSEEHKAVVSDYVSRAQKR